METNDHAETISKSDFIESDSIINEKGESVVHMLPCKINYDGPAPVSSYFHISKKQKKTRNKETILMGHFRGRKLEGLQINLPKTVTGMYTHKNDNNESSQSSASIIVDGTFKSMSVWEHDKEPITSVSNIQDCIDWFDLADAIHS